MKNPISLRNVDLNKTMFENIMFFSYAEGGAMGEPCAILFYTKNGEFYHMNYVYGDVDIKKVEGLFPVFAECRFGMFGLNTQVPDGWNYIDLGMGNHLIVNDKVYTMFVKMIGKDIEPPIVFRRWVEVADALLNS